MRNIVEIPPNEPLIGNHGRSPPSRSVDFLFCMPPTVPSQPHLTYLIDTDTSYRLEHGLLRRCTRVAPPIRRLTLMSLILGYRPAVGP